MLSEKKMIVFLEDVNSKFDAIMEVVLPMREDVAKLKTDMDEVKADLKIVKAVVTDHSIEQNDIKARVSHLEAA